MTFLSFITHLSYVSKAGYRTALLKIVDTENTTRRICGKIALSIPEVFISIFSGNVPEAMKDFRGKT